MNFLEQERLRYEGARAGLQGRGREDCPFDRETQNEEWNFWVYGCEGARDEMRILESGIVRVCTLNVEAQMKEPREFIVEREWTETTEEAYRNGNWRPRYVAVPVEWRKK